MPATVARSGSKGNNMNSETSSIHYWLWCATWLDHHLIRIVFVTHNFRTTDADDIDQNDGFLTNMLFV